MRGVVVPVDSKVSQEKERSSSSITEIEEGGQGGVGKNLKGRPGERKALEHTAS